MTPAIASGQYPHAEAREEVWRGEKSQKQTNSKQHLSKQTTKRIMKGPECTFGARECLQLKKKKMQVKEMNKGQNGCASSVGRPLYCMYVLRT